MAGEAEARLRKKITPKPYTPKYSSIVMDADTGHILHNEDADGIRHPASLTKMMTLYMVFEALKGKKISLQTKIPVSAKASRQAPSKLGLQPGETISIKTVILGLVTKSANDAAVVVAEFLGETEDAFARKMTQKARALGMTKTVFKNASGLPNLGQVTSAKDMAILSRALYRDYPNQYKYFSLRSFIHRGIEHRNHNHLLGKVNGVDGIKTGFIGASGFNLAASAVRLNSNNYKRRLITVVMGGANRHWRDRRVTELLETHFAKEGAHQVVPQLDDTQLNELIYEFEDDDDLNSAKSSSPKVDPNIDNLVHEVFEEHYIENNVTPSSADQDKKPLQISQTAESSTRVEKKSGLASSKTRILQLAVVSTDKKARDAARSAVKKLGLGHPKVYKIQRGKKTLYSPQITGVPKDKASNSCQIIGGKCFVLA